MDWGYITSAPRFSGYDIALNSLFLRALDAMVECCAALKAPSATYTAARSRIAANLGKLLQLPGRDAAARAEPEPCPARGRGGEGEEEEGWVLLDACGADEAEEGPPAAAAAASGACKLASNFQV